MESVEQREEEKKVVIYTKKGDKGETSLYNGERLKKSHIYFDTLGNLDKLNCWIGQVWASCDKLPSYTFDIETIKKDISYIQSLIFDISSYIATPPDSSDKKLERVSK
jgi:cob(I)alamin adenosyltransferase